jgi:hypothetical protein
MAGRGALAVRRTLAAAVLASVVAAAAISMLTLLGACTSGTTPNCADAAEMCDPYEAGPGDGAAESSLHGG